MGRAVCWLVLLVLLAGCGGSGSSGAAQTGAEASFAGTLAAEDWSKTEESYCQGGGEYYVLADGAERYPLDSERDRPNAQERAAERAALRAQLAGLVGQRVTLRGRLLTRTFAQAEHCPDPTMQCPSGPITCRWIRVAAVGR